MHMLRLPRPSWCVDVSDLEAVEGQGATTLSILDVETATIYTAPLRLLRDRGFNVNRGRGAQVGLPLEHWDQKKAPGSQGARQLPLGLEGGRDGL